MLEPDWYPRDRQLRQFAVASLIGFGILGVVAWKALGLFPVALVLWTVFTLTFLVGLPFPKAIRPVYAFVMGVTLPIGWLISNLLLRLIYYGVFTPIALLFRVMGRDALELKRPRTETYWKPYRQPTDMGSYYRQG